MSSSSPPRNPTPKSSESASPDSDDEDEEISSILKLDLNVVHSPEPIASYDPDEPHFSPQTIASFNPNLDHTSSIYSCIDPETEIAQVIKSQGVDMSDHIMMQQKMAHAGSYNLPGSLNVYPEIDEETANLMREQGWDMSECLRQRQALEYYNQMRQSPPQEPAGMSTSEALVQGKKSGIKTIKERARRGSEGEMQQGNAEESAAIKDTDVGENVKKPTGKPVKFKELEEPNNVQHEEDDSGEFDNFLFYTMNVEQEDDYHALKLFLRLKKDGNISPPQHFERARFERKENLLETRYHSFVREYGKKLLSKDALPKESGYQMYRMSRFLWGDHFIQSGGSSTSTGVDGSFDRDDYRAYFDPNAPFLHPDMKCYPYDPEYDPKKHSDPHSSHDSCHDPGVVLDPNGPSVQNGSNVSVLKVDPYGSYLDPNEELEPDDPYFDDSDDSVLERIKACFGSLDPIPAPVTRVTAAGQKIIVKGPRAQTVNVNSGRDRELEAVTTRASAISLEEVPEDSEDADIARAIEISLGKVPEVTKGERIAHQIDTGLPIKKRYKLAVLTDEEQSKRRKLLESPPNALPEPWHQMQKEEENMLLLPNSDNVADDDYETLKFLMSCPLQQTFTMQWGFLPPNFEISLTEHINGILPSHQKITTDQCKMKVSSLFKKFFKFRELNGVEALSEADFSVSREYEMYKMFKTLWVDGPESGESGSAGGSRLDPTQAYVTRVSAAGTKLIFKAPRAQAVNVESERHREFEDDMARALKMSLEDGQGSGGSGSSGDLESCLQQGVNVGNTVHGAGGILKDIKMNVDSDNVEDPRKNMDVADPTGTDDDQVNSSTNMAVDGGQENADEMEVDEPSEK